MKTHLFAFSMLVVLSSCADKPQIAARAPESRSEVQAQFELLAQRAVDHQVAYQRRWPDRSAAALQAFQRGSDKLLVQLRRIDPATLGRESATYEILKEQLEAEQQYRICRAELWDVNHVSGWHLGLVRVAQAQPVGTADERAEVLEMWGAAPRMVDREIDNLRRGLAAGYSAPKSVVRRVIKQISGLLDAPVGKSPLDSPAERSDDTRFKASFLAVIADEARPALVRYRDYLQKHYLPKARDTLGVAVHPNGAQCYQASLRLYTTLNRSAQEVYDLGKRTVERNAGIVADLGAHKFGTRDLSTIVLKIKEAPDNRFASEEELIEFSRAALTRAREKSEPLFEHMPTQAVLVEPFPEFMRGSGTSGHYESQADLSKPAYYRISTDYWSDDTRSDAEDAVAHETFPGHHVQLSLEHMLERSSAAKLWHNFAYTEGWARYSEMLAEEAGIYQTDYIRMSRRIWPARAMVADPGLHVLGWTREQTLGYVAEAGRTGQKAEDLLDRMAIMPGFVTAYDSGGLEIMALREQAQRELGKDFDVRAFHSVVLNQGTVPLGILRRNVEAWIAARKTG